MILLFVHPYVVQKFFDDLTEFSIAGLLDQLDGIGVNFA